MVLLGLRTRTKKSLTVHIDYIIRINDIKPWPPSRSLRSLRSVLVKWQHGENPSGSTNEVVPSLGADVCDGRIEFNESISLSVTLKRELTASNGNGYTFQKSCIEFNLYEPRRDRTMKAQLLGTAVLDLSDHGFVRECLSVSVPVNCKRSCGNTVQPLLYLDIQSFQRQRSGSLMRESSVDRNQVESVSELMGEEYADEAETIGDTSSSSSPQNKEKRLSSRVISNKHNKESDSLKDNVEDSSISAANVESNRQPYTKFGFFLSHPQEDDDVDGSSPDSDSLVVSERTKDDETRVKQDLEEEPPLSDSSHNDSVEQITSENSVLSSSGDDEASSIHSHMSNVDIPKHPMSVRSSADSSSNGSIKTNPFIVADIVTNGRDPLSSIRRDLNLCVKESENQLLESKIQQLEHRVKALEGELREAAGIEISLYSVIAEHGRSAVKVHAPARRLSRLYSRASKQCSGSSRSHVSNSIVSGLVVVAKACGNDVPRLTFWLSNAIVLRVLVRNHILLSAVDKKSSPLKRESSLRSVTEESLGNLENPSSFVFALEKVEKWMFSRIIESLWWQIFTPHMQSGAAEAIRKSINTESCTSDLVDQQHGKYSVELWKKAFRDSSERICPLRAQGHDCGCVPLLSRLIMERLIARLDVAMFNAILRESAEDIPTDPVADPISDAYVLPISTGKASFGAGAQLKNAIGNWCTWLADHFGISDCADLLKNGSSFGHEDVEDEDKQIRSSDGSSQYFHLLTTLSDLMMLPKDMLLSRTIRKEVCPTFGPPLIRRVLNSFVPDEFCPEPIPEVVLEALNSEDPYDDDYGEDSITILPCAAPPTIYHTPSADSVARFIEGIGNNSSDSKSRRSGCSALTKSQTSDDELEELESPQSCIISRSSTDAEGCNNIIRYQLLRESWMNV